MGRWQQRAAMFSAVLDWAVHGWDTASWMLDARRWPVRGRCCSHEIRVVLARAGSGVSVMRKCRQPVLFANGLSGGWSVSFTINTLWP